MWSNPQPSDPAHGVGNCRSLLRYFCVVCWQLVCWCKGAADEADVAGALSALAHPLATDAGVCDDCWFHLGGGATLTAQEETEVDFDGERDPEAFDA